MQRREFLGGSLAAIAAVPRRLAQKFDLAAFERDARLLAADRYLC